MKIKNLIYLLSLFDPELEVLIHQNGEYGDKEPISVEEHNLNYEDKVIIK